MRNYRPGKDACTDRKRSRNLLQVPAPIALNSQRFSYSLHFATDIGLGNLRVTARHVRVRMAEYLGDDVDRHAVFDGQRSEKYAAQCVVKVLLNVTQVGNLFQIGVHLLITRHGQQLTFDLQFCIMSVFVQQFDRMGQRVVRGSSPLSSPRFMNPKHTLLVGRDMLLAQIVRIVQKGQSGQAAKDEDIPDSVEPLVG